MPKTRPPYPAEFREQALRLLESGDRSPNELARELGVSAQTLRNWRRQARIDARPPAAAASGPLSSDERARLRQLERENRVLREEREILKKAAAWFATETTRPSGSR
jgi:transposase